MRRHPTPQYGHTESTFFVTRGLSELAAGSSAFVGHACTHSPQLTQVLSPIERSASNVILDSDPRKEYPITSWTCSSRQALTQRPHWMQSLRFTDIAWLVLSDGNCARVAKRFSFNSNVLVKAASSESVSISDELILVSDAKSSTTSRWLNLALLLVDLTSIPFVGCLQQDAAKARSPSISTTHALQFPSGLYPAR